MNQPSYMTDEEFRKFKSQINIKIGDYTIEPKLDFGSQPHLVDGEYIDVGWIITKDGCLAAPGGTWARDIIQAKQMIGALIASKGDPDVYHGLMMLVRQPNDHQA